MSEEDPNLEFPNIDNLYIKISNLELYPRTNTFQDETVLLDKLIIEEDMFADSVFGTIEYMDSSKDLELTNQLSLGDPVTISFDGDTFDFKILDINVTSDIASKKTIGPDSRPTKIVVRFTSDVFINQNYNFTLTEDFIGKISIIDDDRSKEQYLPEISLEYAGDVIEDYEPLEGFMQTKVAPILNKELLADSTFNDVWIKADPTHYPYDKFANSIKLSQLINYMCEYACDINNKNAVNFFFWEDLYNWNFRSLESILTEYKNISNEDLPYFTPTTDENNLGAIVYFEVINAVIPSKLLNGGAFVSEYIRVKPKWEENFNFYLDTKENVTKERFVYDYDTDLEWETIASDPVAKYKGRSEILRLTDTIYGYYNNPFNKSTVPWWNYNDNVHEYTDIDYNISVQPNRLESEYWQSQFDFCELPGDYLKIIYKNIKWNNELFLNRQEYTNQKRLKRKWEAYKKTACCIRDLPETFFALLTSAKKIHGGRGNTFADSSGNMQTIPFDSGGVWRYEWCEVEFWPRSDTSKIPAPSINSETGEPNSWSDYSIIEFEDNSFPFVFVKPKGFMEGFEPIDPTNPDNRAYNLNELLNSRAPVDYEYDAAGPFTLIMNTGISDALGFTGEKADKGTITSYPLGFKMMPVGKFRIVNKLENPCDVNWSETGTDANSDFYQAGRIVQMFRIPKETLTNIQGATVVDIVLEDEIGPYPGVRDGISNMFIFDIENAHDGLCVDCQ